MNKKLNKSLYRKDLDTFTYWPLLPNFEETKEYKNGFLKLDTGESIFDVPKKILDTLKTLEYKYYPGISDELISLIAKRNKITKENIFLGSGSLNLLDAVIRLFIDPDDEVITCSPTYVMYEYLVQLARGKVIDIPRKNTEIDINAIKNSLTKKTKMIIVDNPSNPFGYTISQKQIRSLLDLQIIVVIDEAYYDFYGKTAIPLLKNYPNLIVLRTFSKAMGVAGMRLAYAITSEQIRESLVKIKIPYQVTVASQFIGKELLKDKAIIKQTAALIDGREYLLKNIRKISYLDVYPSQGAYIVMKSNSPKISANDLYTLFYNNKILIKKMDYPALGNELLRINIVPIPIAKKIIEILQNYEI